MNRLSRSTALKIAAVLSLLAGVWSFVDAIPYLIRGAAFNEATDGPFQVPYFVIMLAFVLAIVKIISAYGAWQSQRWGVVLTLLANAVDMVAAAPGVLFAPIMYLWISSMVFMVVGTMIIVLCLWRDPKPATV